MKSNVIFLKTIVVTLLLIFSAQNSLAQEYQAYETLLGRGDSKYNSGVNNFNSKKYQAALTDFNDAIRYYESSKKINPKPANAEAEIEKKIAAAKEKIRNINRATNPATPPAPPAPVIPELTVKKDRVSFDPSGGEDQVVVISNVTWEIEKDAVDWCKIEKGSGGDYVIITCEENTVPERRDLSFRVIAGDSSRLVTILQKGTEPFLSIKEEDKVLTYMPYKNTASIKLETNIPDWEVVTDEAPDRWLNVSRKDDAVEISFEDYREEFPRSHTFKIKANNIETPVEIKVNQLGLRFDVYPKELSFPRTGGTGTLKINSTYNTGWSYMRDSLPEWGKVEEPTKDSLTISTSSNPGAKREGKITIISGGKTEIVKITQEEAEEIISVSETVYAFSYEGASKKIILPGASGWKLTRIPYWCQLTDQTESDFTIKCPKNTFTIPRMDTIEVTAPYKTVKIRITQDSKKIPASRYDFVGPFYENLAIVRANNKYGYIAKNGKEVIPVVYDGANDFVDGMAIVGSKDKLGYIDKKGRPVTPIKYDSIRPFSEGTAVVGLNGKYGYINLKGEELGGITYDLASDFKNGIGVAKSGETTFYVNRKGIGSTALP
jgi:hypothetical protein